MNYEPEPRHVCLARDRIYVCTLTTGHPGEHQAWTGNKDIAHTWPNQQHTGDAA